MTISYSTDIAIFGGGIAGLWLLKRLRLEGYQAILFETGSLGGGQTLASQGIIHGGLKYALSGSLTPAANIIAGMPQRWRQCLQGEGEMDLSGVEVLSDHYYMWSESSFRSKLKTFLGSKSLVGRVSQLSKAEQPAFFAEASVNGSLYQLPDFVVNTDSLLAKLVAGEEEHIFKLGDQQPRFVRDDNGNIGTIEIDSAAGTVRIDTQRTVLCAGEGNAALIRACGLSGVGAQTRPLNMVYLKKRDLPRIFVHCIGNDFGLTPRLTITSHLDAHGDTVWYLGGELAESGVGKSDVEQIAAAKKLMATYFPWLALDDCRWHCFEINRAEANINNNTRPDGAYLATESQVIAAWPTKLTLTPALADMLVEQLRGDGLVTAASGCAALRQQLAAPAMASPRWD